VADSQAEAGDWLSELDHQIAKAKERSASEVREGYTVCEERKPPSPGSRDHAEMNLYPMDPLGPPSLPQESAAAGGAPGETRPLP
jgi:hypothetical protein